MSRLGPWVPATVEERLDRIESLSEIEQLPRRYARFLDARDMDSLMELFLPNVQVGRDQHGREALKQWFRESMSKMRISIHITANHVIDFDDANHAHGIVYCFDQLEQPSDSTWEVGHLQYWDTYERLNGEWYFARRRFHRWYLCDALTRPASGLGTESGRHGLTTHVLPDAFDTWQPFWDDARADGLVPW